MTLSEEPTVAPPPPAVVVICGPSGVGKDAVIRRLQQVRPELHMVVTAGPRHHCTPLQVMFGKVDHIGCCRVG